jgi:integrase
MPLTLVPPNPARRSPNYRVRGTYLGQYIDRSTETGDRRKAQAFLRRIEEAIERGHFSAAPPLSFAAAATAYMQGGGEKRFLARVIKYFGLTAASAIDQTALDAGATALYPAATPATRNRQFYTPALSVLRHAGIETPFRRPKDALGTPRRIFLTGKQFERLVIAARAQDGEFEALITLLFYTGLRLSEALGLRCADIHLSDTLAYCGKTKNGEPRTVYLPPRVVAALANHPRGLDRADRRLFKWSKGGALYNLAKEVYKAAGVNDGGARFHIFRHSYGKHMTAAGADLVATNVWKSPTAARGYQHFTANEEARKADLIPGSGAKARNKS